VLASAKSACRRERQSKCSRRLTAPAWQRPAPPIFGTPIFGHTEKALKRTALDTVRKTPRRNATRRCATVVNDG
jgi:hypothetical protein